MWYNYHEALKSVINMCDPHGRIAMWMSFFAEFDLQIKYRSGQKQATADYITLPVDDAVMEMSKTLLGLRRHVVPQYIGRDNVQTVWVQPDIDTYRYA